MGLKLWRRHLEEAAANPPMQITNVRKTDDNIVGFSYTYVKDGRPLEVNVQACAADVDEYPDGNTYFLYTDDVNADPVIAKGLEHLTDAVTSKSIPEVLLTVTASLRHVLTLGQSANPIDLDGDHDDNDSFVSAREDIDDYDLEQYSDDDGALFGDDSQLKSAKSPAINISGCGSKISNEKIRADLRAVKEAGLRIGVLGNLPVGGILCISVRVVKLGISEEAMQAWGLRRQHYLVLMIRFQDGYRTLEQVKEDNVLEGKTEMRVALCEHYKPTLDDALAVFNQVQLGGPASQSQSKATMGSLEPLFIAGPLNSLLRERFTKIVKFRESCAFTWFSAENFVNDIQGKSFSINDVVGEYATLEDVAGRTLPPIVQADAMAGALLKDISLPLVAMQFVLRHFVRCTEFCLVCHCKVEDTFEALKPYVCSKPLCLYQYMALGFGPSIEWEILSQPYVVDLLISFCYVAARQGRLKDFPVGIDLKVPVLPFYNDAVVGYPHAYGIAATAATAAKPITINSSFTARLDYKNNEILFEIEQQNSVANLHVGDRLVLVARHNKKEYIHYRISEVMFPVLKLDGAVHLQHQAGPGSIDSQQTPDHSPKLHPAGYSIVDCYRYDRSLDTLGDEQKRHAITTLLDTLPEVKDMRRHLNRKQQGRDPSLRNWQQRISDSALNLLRWIIASNRSCIMQVDNVEDDDFGKRSENAQDRVYGMEGYMQFRFAQGAPDKEQRFMNCVEQETITSKYPTLFAWHGSPLGNWHSIVREGLHYKETIHGRSFGHGVYMSPLSATSLGYTTAVPYYSSWPNSALKISSALSLNEVINAPSKFVSRTPHYVVADIDWIQTRYLFVKTSLRLAASIKTPNVEYEQDPAVVALGDKSQHVSIPITAVSKSCRPASTEKPLANGAKRVKGTTFTTQAIAEGLEDDANSIISDDADREYLESTVDNFDQMSLVDSDDEGQRSITRRLATSGKRPYKPDEKKTDFVPGNLDISSIRFLQPPKDASTVASKALMQAFKDAQKIQAVTPLHELGWYIDPDLMSNMYQWIVELHSFDSSIPLARDMKVAGITSIVLEMRFTNQYPFSPPFVRVVRPRFLPFGQGGGGNVTEGGALCMELLTNDGWSVVSTIESVLLQVRMVMSDTERPARLASGIEKTVGGSSYGVGEAITAYERACRAHGWQVPKGFDTLQRDAEARGRSA